MTTTETLGGQLVLLFNSNTDAVLICILNVVSMNWAVSEITISKSKEQTRQDRTQLQVLSLHSALLLGCVGKRSGSSDRVTQVQHVKSNMVS